MPTGGFGTHADSFAGFAPASSGSSPFSCSCRVTSPVRALAACPRALGRDDEFKLYLHARGRRRHPAGDLSRSPSGGCGQASFGDLHRDDDRLRTPTSLRGLVDRDGDRRVCRRRLRGLDWLYKVVRTDPGSRRRNTQAVQPEIVAPIAQQDRGRRAQRFALCTFTLLYIGHGRVGALFQSRYDARCRDRWTPLRRVRALHRVGFAGQLVRAPRPGPASPSP